MSIRFSPLLMLGVDHDYYDGACRDLSFSVLSATVELLQGARTIARMVDGNVLVLAEVDALGAPMVSLAGQTLEFGVRLANSYFDNFTVPPLADAALVPLYANSAAVTALDVPIGVEIAAGIWRATPRDAARPVRLTLSDLNGNELETRTLDAGADETSYDLRRLPRGRYRLTEDYGGGQVETRELLVFDQAVDESVWGVVRVAVDPAFYAAPPAFSLNFSARTETLKYYVVADDYTQFEFDQLAAADRGFTEEGRAEIQFDKVLPAAFTASDIDPALLSADVARVVSFQSKTPVARRARGPKKIQLSRNGSVLIEHLPTPGPERSQAYWIVQLTKP